MSEQKEVVEIIEVVEIVEIVEENDKEIEYTVNGEKQKTRRHELEVRRILENAGFVPPADYQLTRDSDGHKYEDLDDKVHVHEGEAFTATFVGPTPTS